ncbi:hypothetical protein B0H10DRAFT_1952804 [Mycena sp. CBHHK59/15]|nr:hypothetical protein B0H10DRAFT_1952804 [Mycena sp. CBHHK59/15]
MTLATAESALEDFLGDHFMPGSAWRNALGRLMEFADGDEVLKVLAQIRAELKPPFSRAPTNATWAPQLVQLEGGIQDQLTSLRHRKKIAAVGMPSLDELLDPPEEHEIGQTLYKQSAWELNIVAQVHHEEAVTHGDIMEVDNESSDDEEPEDPEMSTHQIMDLFRTLEKACLLNGDLWKAWRLPPIFGSFTGIFNGIKWLG